MIDAIETGATLISNPVRRLASRLRAGAAAVLLLVTQAGFTHQASASEPAKAAPTAEVQALLRLRDQDRRVMAVADRMIGAAVDLCARKRPSLGWGLHDLSQYRSGLRPAVTAAFGLHPGAAGVMTLDPEGPAARAGVREDDLILALNGATLGAAPPEGADASYAFMTQVEARLDGLTAGRVVTLQLLRDGRRITLTATPVAACAWKVQVVPSENFHAGADGDRITLSTTMVDYAARDEDLAFFMGHEMAHGLLNHPPRRHLLATSGRSAREQAADRAGLYLAARAGFDPSGAPALFRRIGRDFAGTPHALLGYPTPTQRAEAAERTVAEIQALRTAGRSITP